MTYIVAGIALTETEDGMELEGLMLPEGMILLDGALLGGAVERTCIESISKNFPVPASVSSAIFTVCCPGPRLLE